MTKKSDASKVGSHLPSWVNIILELQSTPTYIKERIRLHNLNLKHALTEIEEKLPGLKQRMIFLIFAINHAVRYRPIPNAGDNKTRRPQDKLPSARQDLKTYQELKPIIAQTAKQLANQLRQFDAAYRNLNAEFIQCHPLELIYDIAAEKSDDSVINFGEDDIQTLERLSVDSFLFPHLALAELMDRVYAAASVESKRIYPKNYLPVSSRKTMYHFYEAFSWWLEDNSVSEGGIIPDDFSLSDRCWIELTNCLTEFEVTEKSFSLYRGRVKKLIEASNNELKKLLDEGDGQFLPDADKLDELLKSFVKGDEEG